MHRLVASKQVTPLPSEQDAEMYEATMEILEHHGFEHYEVSNYAKNGFACKHNNNYWNHSNYLSFGPSAHSYWNNGDAKRWWNIFNLSTYAQKIFSKELPISGEEILSEEQCFDERIMLGLRSDGIDYVALQKDFHYDFLTERQHLISELLANDLVNFFNNKLRLTNKGFLLCEEITQRLLTRVSV